MEDAPPSVHFCTDAFTIGGGLEERIETFIAEHSDTTLIIIDTLQMVRGAGYDNTYANDYRDLSILKKLADKHGVAILLIHHLRKEGADDVFNRISGTTGVQGAVDSSFTQIPQISSLLTLYAGAWIRKPSLWEGQAKRPAIRRPH
jgi:hypothetical protein